MDTAIYPVAGANTELGGAWKRYTHGKNGNFNGETDDQAVDLGVPTNFMISKLSSVLGVNIVTACPSKTDDGPCYGDRSKTHASHMPCEWGNEYPRVQHLF